MKATRNTARGNRLQAIGRKAPNTFHYVQCLTWTLPLLFCFLLTTLSVSWGQQNGDAPKKVNPYTGQAEAIAEGQKLYKQWNCYGCHGMQGGGGMGPNLADETWQTGDGSDSNLLEQVRNGKGTMPAYKAFITDDEAWKLIAFIRTLYKGDPAKVKW